MTLGIRLVLIWHDYIVLLHPDDHSLKSVFQEYLCKKNHSRKIIKFWVFNIKYKNGLMICCRSFFRRVFTVCQQKWFRLGNNFVATGCIFILQLTPNQKFIVLNKVSFIFQQLLRHTVSTWKNPSQFTWVGIVKLSGWTHRIGGAVHVKPVSHVWSCESLCIANDSIRCFVFH